jgi:hypothetical protein
MNFIIIIIIYSREILIICYFTIISNILLILRQLIFLGNLEVFLSQKNFSVWALSQKIWKVIVTPNIILNYIR